MAVSEEDVDRMAYNMIPMFVEDFKSSIRLHKDTPDLEEGKLLNLKEISETAEKIEEILEKSGPTHYY